MSDSPLQVTVWSDYCCPWCYLALDREDLLTGLGVEVTVLPYELHPDTPLRGLSHRRGGRTAAVYASLADELAEAGLPFSAPTRTPNTRTALEVAEAVRRHQPHAFAALHRSLFTAHFAGGRDLGDPTVVDDLVARAGADPDEARAADAAPAVAEARARAGEHGIAGTPAFLFGDALVVPGLQPRATLTRWVERLQRSVSSTD